MGADAVTIFGLGEAGSSVARHLVAEGLEVRAFDPRQVPTPHGVARHPDPDAAVAGTGAVLALTAAKDACTAFEQALHRIPRGSLYADLATAAPEVKRDLATAADRAGLRFADVALMGTVPDRGLRTPQLASGPGADIYAARFEPCGAQVEVVGSDPGDAAARKLLRSVAIKGLTAALIEALRAGQAAGVQDWLWTHLTERGPIPIARAIVAANANRQRRVLGPVVDGSIRRWVSQVGWLHRAAARGRHVERPSPPSTGGGRPTGRQPVSRRCHLDENGLVRITNEGSLRDSILRSGRRSSQVTRRAPGTHCRPPCRRTRPVRQPPAWAATRGRRSTRCSSPSCGRCC